MTVALFQKKDLVWQLVLRNLKVRYSRPVLGFLWPLLSPLFMVAVFYIAFAQILKVNIPEAPFIAYLMSAVFPWSIFQDSVLSSATSLVDNRNLLKESRFPQYLIPVSVVLTNALVFLPALVIIIISSLVMLKGLPFFFILLPFVLLVHLILTVSLAIIASILYVKWRDTKFVLDAIFLLAFYLTPAFYSLQLVKTAFTQLAYQAYLLNPFVGMLCMYRITLFKGFRRYAW